MQYFLGVDGGGSKTLAVLADAKGRVVGVGLGGSGNFQGPGVEVARESVRVCTQEALCQAGIQSQDVTASFFGMAGADRPRDFAIVRELLAPIAPGQSWDLENDAVIGLYAGTGDGIGVGVICGSGTNVIGLGPQHKRVQVGGMGELFGDAAGGGHIGRMAVAQAMRGHEGRGRATSLYPVLCQHFAVDELLDLVDWMYEGRSPNLRELAPIVFQEAVAGDPVATGILTDVGEEMAVSTLVALEQLFSHTDRPVVVAMGSVFQQAESPIMLQAFTQRLAVAWPQIEVRVLDCEPALGAVYAAVGLDGTPPTETFRQNLRASFPGRPRTQS